MDLLEKKKGTNFLLFRKKNRTGFLEFLNLTPTFRLKLKHVEILSSSFKGFFCNTSELQIKKSYHKYIDLQIFPALCCRSYLVLKKLA